MPTLSPDRGTDPRVARSVSFRRYSSFSFPPIGGTPGAKYVLTVADFRYALCNPGSNVRWRTASVIPTISQKKKTVALVAAYRNRILLFTLTLLHTPLPPPPPFMWGRRQIKHGEKRGENATVAYFCILLLLPYAGCHVIVAASPQKPWWVGGGGKKCFVFFLFQFGGLSLDIV